jgi:hypothetical protein
MLGRADVTGLQIAEAFLLARRRMERALRRFEAPFIATVTLEGGCVVLWNRHGRLKPPKRLK